MLAKVGSDEAQGLREGAGVPTADDGALAAVADDELKQTSPSGGERFVDANGVPVRIPKLAVRHRKTDNISTIGRPASAMEYARSEGANSGPPSSRSSERMSTTTSHRSFSDDVVPTRRSLTSRDDPKDTQIPTKKKKKGVFGFLTLKEPSTSAWAEFAEAEKERARQKGVDPTTKGIPGVSPQKMPDHVPKVNSKWDGLPDGAKRQSSESKSTRRGHRDSTFSTSTRQSNWTAITSVSTVSAELRRTYGTPLQSPLWPNRPSTQSNHPWSPDDWRTSIGSASHPTTIDPTPRTLPIEESEENRPQTFLLPPSPEGHEKILLPDPTAHITPLTPPEMSPGEARYPQELNARMSTDSDQVAEMPATPPTDEDDGEPMLIGIHYPELDSPQRDPRIASYDFGSDSEADMKTTNNPTPSADSPRRRAINFSRPRSMLPSDFRSMQSPPLSIDEVAGKATPSERAPVSPNSTTDAGRVEPFLTDTFAMYSKKTGHIPQRVSSTVEPSTRTQDKEAMNQADTPVSPIADCEIHDSFPAEPDFSTSSPSQDVRPDTALSSSTAGHEDASAIRSGSQVSLTPSNAPSAMSESWQLSPRERLGLGSKVRRSEVLPWETTEDLGDMDAPVSPVQESKRKRLSLRLSSKK